jgi:hypothetical protein
MAIHWKIGDSGGAFFFLMDVSFYFSGYDPTHPLIRKCSLAILMMSSMKGFISLCK